MNITNSDFSQNKSALFILPTDRLGGTERVTLTLIDGFIKKESYSRVDIFILSLNPSGTLEYLMDNHGCNIIYTGASREKYGILPLVNYLLSQQYDFCFTSFPSLNALCCVFRRLKILRTHRLVTRESAMTFDGSLTKRIALIRTLFHLYGNQEIIVCQTSLMARRFNFRTNNRYQSKVMILPNPIDMKRIDRDKGQGTEILANISKEKIKIVWCGRLIPLKRVDRAITAVTRINDSSDYKLQLVIVGDGPLRSELEVQVSKIGATDYVTFCGHQNNPISVMSKCDYGILTSDKEGFPNVILEMLAAGVKRVVTTNCTGDIDSMPGVAVANELSAESLSACLFGVIDLERDINVREFLLKRNVTVSIKRLLEENNTP